MCYYELYQKYKIYIPTMVFGVILEIIGSVMVGVGAAHDFKELYGWGIFIDIVGLVSFIFGFWILCMLYNPECRKAHTEEAPKVPKHFMFRQGPFSQFGAPSHAPTFEQPNALAVQQDFNDPYGNQRYMEAQGSFTSSVPNYSTGQRPLLQSQGSMPYGPQYSVPQGSQQPYGRPPSTGSGFYQGSVGPAGSNYGPPPPQPTGPRTAYQAQGGASGASYMI